MQIVSSDKWPIAILLFGGTPLIGGYEEEASVLHHPFLLQEGPIPRGDGGMDIRIILRKILMSRKTPAKIALQAKPVAVFWLEDDDKADKQIAEAYSTALNEEAMRNAGIVAADQSALDALRRSRPPR